MIDRTIIRPWIDAASMCETKLRDLNSSTEGDFLAIGSGLADLSAQVQDITRCASTAAGLTGSAEAEEGIEGLERMRVRTESYLKDVVGDADRISRVLMEVAKNVASAYEPLSGFKKIVKRLLVLGVSTKIESARLSAGGNSFSVLAEDVERLSAVIAAKSAHILNGLKSLTEVINETRIQFTAIQEKEHGQTRVILSNMGASLSSLRERYQRSGETILRIEDRSREIAGDVGEIVASLQFHDITRQQIEHVIEVLEEFADKISSATVEDHSVSEWSDMMELQVLQLDNSKKELASAIRTTVEDMKGIAHRVNDIAGEIVQLVQETGTVGSSFFSTLKKDMTRVMESLAENVETNRQLSGGVERVMSTVADMVQFVAEIEEIGTEIELIALNARVKAAHTGTEGAGLGVLAEAIRSLSDHARTYTSSISDALMKTSSVTRTLETGDNGHQAEEFAGVEGDMGLLLASFEKKGGEVTPLLLRMENLGNVVGEAIEETIEKVTVHHLSDKVLNDVSSHIRTIAKEVHSVDPGAPGGGNGDRLKALEARYTMDRERILHKAHRGIHVSEKAEQELDDNVELF